MRIKDLKRIWRVLWINIYSSTCWVHDDDDDDIFLINANKANKLQLKTISEGLHWKLNLGAHKQELSIVSYLKVTDE